MTKKIKKFEEVINQYDGFIFDQFGVIHNGKQIHKNAEDCFFQILKKNKKILLLSNSGKSSKINKERIKSIGSKIIHEQKMITSGDVCKKLLLEKKYPLNNIGNKYFLIGSNYDLLKGTDYQKTEDIDDSDFLLLNTLPNDNNKEINLDKSIRNNKLLICANPDLLGVSGNKVSKSVGSFALEYESKGGRVIFIGKPYSNVFDIALNYFANIKKERILMIGDSLFHDIKGATKADIDSLFILSGIHKNDFELLEDHYIKNKILNLTKNKYIPTYFCNFLKY